MQVEHNNVNDYDINMVTIRDIMQVNLMSFYIKRVIILFLLKKNKAFGFRFLS